MRLVENARHAYRWLSVQMFAVLAVVPIVWAELPEDVRAYIPEGWAPYIVALVAAGGIVGRLKAQDE